MSEHSCIHEEDFGTIFERVKNMNESFEGQKVAVEALLKHMHEKEILELNREKESLTARQKVSIYVSAILGISGIICSIILKFA